MNISSLTDTGYEWQQDHQYRLWMPASSPVQVMDISPPVQAAAERGRHSIVKGFLKNHLNPKGNGFLK